MLSSHVPAPRKKEQLEHCCLTYRSWSEVNGYCLLTSGRLKVYFPTVFLRCLKQVLKKRTAVMGRRHPMHNVRWYKLTHKHTFLEMCVCVCVHHLCTHIPQKVINAQNAIPPKFNTQKYKRVTLSCYYTHEHSERYTNEKHQMSYRNSDTNTVTVTWLKYISDKVCFCVTFASWQHFRHLHIIHIGDIYWTETFLHNHCLDFLWVLKSASISFCHSNEMAALVRETLNMPGITQAYPKKSN